VGIESLTPVARALARGSLGLADRETLLVVSDGRGPDELAVAFTIAAGEVGAGAIVLKHEPLTAHPLVEYCWFAGRSLKPPLDVPPVVLAAVLEADAVCFLSCDLELMFGDELRNALREGGARAILLPYLDAPSARRLLPAAAAEIGELHASTRRFGDIFRRSTEAHVRSPGGTDLRLRIGEHETRCHDGIPQAGSLQVMPAGQVAVVPDERSANGTLVVDRTIADGSYRALAEAIVFTVEEGVVVSVAGGAEARLTARFLEAAGDDRAYHLTELGIGTNPVCRQRGVNAPTEDTHAAGVVSFALGCDTHIGGVTPGPFHIDMTMHAATLELDGTAVVRDGALVEQTAAVTEAR
jgi:hypothetical protein